jgi:transmembrane sensor
VSANDNDLSVMEEAADWIDRLDELSDAERRDLAAWLNASPDHAAAFATLRHTLRDTALLEAIDRLRDQPVEAFAPSLASPRRHARLVARRIDRRRPAGLGRRRAPDDPPDRRARRAAD